MTPAKLTRTSKFLSLILRHEPTKFGLTLDEAGWTPVADLLATCATHGNRITLAELELIITTSDKKRFALSEDGLLIRANQGHSTEVTLDHPATTPPATLFHGTFEDAVESILATGLNRGNRHHVHLSADPKTATAVGQRRGSPVVLTIRSTDMHHSGHVFYLTPNHVWLTDHVPPQFISLP